MSKIIEKLQSQIQELEQELEKAKKEEKELQELGEEYILAIDLHSKLCHPPSCYWGYEKNDWNGSEHQKFLKKAKTILKLGLTPDKILQIVKIIKE
jgi:hypothetical protein